MTTSLLFRAVDKPVNKNGLMLAKRMGKGVCGKDLCGNMEINERYGRFDLEEPDGPICVDWMPLFAYYDVLARVQGDRWYLVIGFPRTPEMEELLEPFDEAGGSDDLGIRVEECETRLVVQVACDFREGLLAKHEDDLLEFLVRRLVHIREEILEGNVSFLEAVVCFYEDMKRITIQANSQKRPGAFAAI